MKESACGATRVGFCAATGYEKLEPVFFHTAAAERNCPTVDIMPAMPTPRSRNCRVTQELTVIGPWLAVKSGTCAA